MKPLPANAEQIMVKRYSLRNEKGDLVESPEDILRRTARVVAGAEHSFRDGITPDEVEARFLELLTDLRMMPNGRTLANAGTGSKQLANCFVLPLDDDLGKTADGIFSILRKAVLVLQSGGGVGFSFGRIRPKGDVAGKGKATGAVSFLKVFDTAFWVIGQGGGRRSACMAVLPVHHPDIREFISCKREEGVIEHFNISVGVTDEFMKAVQADSTFDLINPRNGKVWETVRAKELFDEIVEYAHHNGEPGMLFIDAANRDNPVPHQYTLEATNPCGEQWLGPYENCCMASINLAEHTRRKGKGPMRTSAQHSKSKLFTRMVDWDKLQETVEWTVRWLDNVVEANQYVPAVPQLREAAIRNRRIGVSLMGLADMMYKVGVRYGSDEAVDLAGQVMEFIRFHALRMSSRLAEERGAFPGIKDSLYDPNAPTGFFRIPHPVIKYRHIFGRAELDWKGLVKQIREHGVRNSCQTTIQPTGAIATIAGLEGYGCEPVFALSYVMKTHEGAADVDDGKEWRELYYESSLFQDALKEAGLSKRDQETVFALVRAKGSCQDVPQVPKRIREVFVVSSDVTVNEHVKMQASLQAFTDNAISKTINFPAGSNKDEVAQAYLIGWKMGLKGMTVYVTGSRETVVLETAETQAKRQEKEQPFVSNGHTHMSIEESHDLPHETVCPDCGETMQLAEGCATCPACAYSACSV